VSALNEVDVGLCPAGSAVVQLGPSWARAMALTWLGLRKCHRAGGVKRDVALHLLHGLVNMSIENGDGAEAFQVEQCLAAVIRAPSPFRVNAPQWNVSKPLLSSLIKLQVVALGDLDAVVRCSNDTSVKRRRSAPRSGRCAVYVRRTLRRRIVYLLGP
jgi:hypothetical protein